MMQAWSLCVSGCCCLQVQDLLKPGASGMLYGAVCKITSADLPRCPEVLQCLTGLDLEHDTIIEIACLITDGNLEETLEVPWSAGSAFLQLCNWHIACLEQSRTPDRQAVCTTNGIVWHTVSGKACCAGAGHCDTPPGQRAG